MTFVFCVCVFELQQTPKFYKCDLCCCAQISGADQYIAHLRGKRHQKEVAKLVPAKQKEEAQLLAKLLALEAQRKDPNNLHGGQAPPPKQKKVISFKCCFFFLIALYNVATTVLCREAFFYFVLLLDPKCK